MRFSFFPFAAWSLLAATVFSAEIQPIPAQSPAWQELADAFRKNPEVRAAFTERRKFVLKRNVVELTGEVRVSPRDGLSLHYQQPEERIVIVDSAGVVLREEGRDQPAPDDERNATINAAMLDMLRMDLAALERNFTLRGELTPEQWTLVLEPKSKAVQRAFETFQVQGRGATVTRIDLRHGEKRYIEILIAPPSAQGEFSAEERKRFFR